MDKSKTVGFKEICTIPKSLVGRTVFLGLFVGIVTALLFGVWKYAAQALNVIINGSTYAYESQAAAASHALRSAAGIFAGILNFTVIGCIGFAAEWMFVYILCRVVRNAPMGAAQYWRVWQITLFAAFILPICHAAYLFFNATKYLPLIESAVINGSLFVIFYSTAKFAFSTNPPREPAIWKNELSRAEFTGIVRKSIRAAYPHFKRNAIIALIFLSLLGLISGA